MSVSRRDYIQQLIIQHQRMSVADLLAHLKIGRATLRRDLKVLVEQKKIIQVSHGLYAISNSPLHYLETPFFERNAVGYNFEFLRNYIPDRTLFLNQQQRDSLHESTKFIGINTDYYHHNRRLIENILIDVSYASSNLEGNTYSYLDTEVLVKYNEIADDKSKEETQMIINHKKCIEYMMHYKKDLLYTQQSFKEIHTLLGAGLLRDEDLGIIRTKIVEIGGCKYTPLDNQFQLKEEYELFLLKLNAITNPFEQSLFILTFIPYFQLFLDINKRTSRMMCNLPLLKHNLPLLSLLQAKKSEYITAILSVYELNDVSLLAELYTNNYLLNMHRYLPPL